MLVEKLLANDMMTVSCQTKSTIVIRFNLFQVCPPVLYLLCFSLFLLML